MRKHLFSSSSTLLFLLAASPLAQAQVTTGTLSGRVTDAAGRPVVGARVVLTSPVLFEPRELLTNRHGEWFAPGLAVGHYSLRITANGLLGRGADQVRVGTGTSVRQDFTLKPRQEAEATVAVVGRAQGGVDKVDTKASANYGREQLNALPTQGRGFQAAADLAPGVVRGGDGTVSIRGGQLDRTRFTVNGVDVKDDARDSYYADSYRNQKTVANGVNYLEDNIEDVQVVLSPVNARHGRALGGMINVVTRQGTNEFSGSVRAQVTRNAWRGEPRLAPFATQSTNAVVDNLNRTWEVVVGGPVVKDRLWFNLGTRLVPKSSTANVLKGLSGQAVAEANRSQWVTGVSAIDNYFWGLQANGTPLRFAQLDPPTNYTSDTRNHYFEGKLTGAVTTGQVVEFTFSRQSDNYTNQSVGNVGRLAMLGERTYDKQALGLSYRTLIGGRAFLEARFNKTDDALKEPAGDLSLGTGEDVSVTVSDRSRGQGFSAYNGNVAIAGSGSSPLPVRHNSRSANLNLKLYQDFLGTHDLDLGYDYYLFQNQTSRAAGQKNYAIAVGGIFEPVGGGGPDTWRFPTMNQPGTDPRGATLANGGIMGLTPYVRRFFGKDGQADTRSEAFYLNDNWTLNANWTVMLGLRLDLNRCWDTDGSLKGRSQDLSPRVMVNYDPDGQGRHRFVLSAARYTGDFRQNFNRIFIKKADTPMAWMFWTAEKASVFYDPRQATPGYAGSVDANRPITDYVNFRTLQELLNLDNYGLVTSYTDSSLAYRVPKPLATPYSQEVTLGYTRTWDDGSNFKATYVYRSWKREWGIVKSYDRDHVAISNPPEALKDKGPLAMETYDVINSDALKRRYDSLEVEWSVPLSARLVLGGNWTFSSLRGNDNGGDNLAGSVSPTGDGSVIAQGLLGYRPQMAERGISEASMAPYGSLALDVPHRGRLHLTWTVPLGKGSISYALLGRYESGSNYSLSGTSNLPVPVNRLPAEQVNWGGRPWTVTMPAPPTRYVEYFGGRGGFRNNAQAGLDFRLAFSLPLGLGKTQLSGDLQVSNLVNHTYNSSQYLAYQTANDAAAKANYPYFTVQTWSQMYTNYTAPRTVSASLGLRF